jgi:hypothetical protein
MCMITPRSPKRSRAHFRAEVSTSSSVRMWINQPCRTGQTCGLRTLSSGHRRHENTSSPGSVCVPTFDFSHRRCTTGYRYCRSLPGTDRCEARSWDRPTNECLSSYEMPTDFLTDRECCRTDSACRCARGVRQMTVGTREQVRAVSAAAPSIAVAQRSTFNSAPGGARQEPQAPSAER